MADYRREVTGVCSDLAERNTGVMRLAKEAVVSVFRVAARRRANNLLFL
ncbi:MAG: hypothetical protein MK171_12330 [Pirellulales bacterium]|nr:hypothetical protein [Pirellulales bacterium]